MKRSGATRRAGLLVGAALGVVLLLAYALGARSWFADDAADTLRGAPVRRGPLSITVVERGNLKSAQSTTLKSEIEGQTTILWLIEEGTRVQPGDLVCELDASELVERRVQQEISVQSTDAAFVAARQRVEIQKSQNASDISAAERKIEFAEVDVEKYLQGDWPQKLKLADDEILLAQEELKRARDKEEWSRKLADKGFLTRTELEADQLAAKRAELELARAERQRDLLVQYDYPKERKEFEAALEEARQERERMLLRADALLVDYEADMKSNEARLQLEREKLGKLVAQIERAHVRAPVAGMVVYSQQGDGGRGSQAEPIQEGTTVRERQEIITIPSTSGMVAELSLHEAVLQKVTEGQSCRVTLDALQGATFSGRVRFKSSLPDQNQWWANPDQRLYRSQVELLESTPEMRPGMTCNVEILVEEIADTLFVPLQAVFQDGGKSVAFVLTGSSYDKREVTLGASNHKFAEVEQGLDEGETVALSLPAGAVLRPAPEAPPVPLELPSPEPAVRRESRPEGPGRGEGSPGGASGERAGRATRGAE